MIELLRQNIDRIITLMNKGNSFFDAMRMTWEEISKK
jgi:hypothetical protein